MATLTLTDLDKELLDGLQVLTDQEIGRVQAHLAAGLPMQIQFGWYPYGPPSEPACFGCVVGTAMSNTEYRLRRDHLRPLALDIFPFWAMAQDPSSNGSPGINKATLDRLAALLDMEWSRRHPLPAESSHDAIIPSLEAVGV